MTVGYMETATDPLQQRCRDLMRQHREITAELRRVREAMRVGHCEVCGREFMRTRVTRKVCSQACNVKAYAFRAKDCDIDVLRDALPLLKAGRLLTTQSLEIIDQVLAVGNQVLVAEQRGISRQRVQQILSQAMKRARLAVMIRAAVKEQESVHV